MTDLIALQKIAGWEKFLSSQSALIPAESCFLPIVYEDEDLLVLNKASGTPSVSLSASETDSAAAAALAAGVHRLRVRVADEAEPALPGFVGPAPEGDTGCGAGVFAARRR